MKKLFMVAVLIVCGSASALAQGSVIFSNSGGTPLTLADGTTRVRIGSTLQVELMYAPDGTSALDFQTVAVRVGAPANFGPTPGFFSGGGRTVDSIQPPGGFGLFQVRAWETAYGNSYNEVICANPAMAAQSGILRVDTANPLIGEANASLVAAGLSGFSITPVGAPGPGSPCIPEPPTIPLWLLGSALLFLAFRRNSIGNRKRQ
jgi:hypothetical protein